MQIDCTGAYYLCSSINQEPILTGSINPTAMSERVVKTVSILFPGGNLIKVKAYVNEQFYLFGGMSSLTLYMLPGEVDSLESEFIHCCIWESFQDFDDVTIDFKKEVLSISIT